MTGFNLPLGCTTAMIDRAAGAGVQCLCCGHDCDDCQCPDCPVCGDYGNEECYERVGRKGHGLHYSHAQRIARAEIAVADYRNRLSEAQMYLEWVKDHPDESED